MTPYQILTTYRRVAIVGLSPNYLRPSHFVAIYLISKGFEVIPVNPRESTILNRPSYPNLSAIPTPIDIVDIFRDPAAVPAIVDEAIAIHAKVIWMQLSVVNESAAAHAREAGLEVIMDRCMKIEHARHFGGLRTLGLNTGVLSSRKTSRPTPSPELKSKAPETDNPQPHE